MLCLNQRHLQSSQEVLGFCCSTRRESIQVSFTYIIISMIFFLDKKTIFYSFLHAYKNGNSNLFVAIATQVQFEILSQICKTTAKYFVKEKKIIHYLKQKKKVILRVYSKQKQIEVQRILMNSKPLFECNLFDLCAIYPHIF